MGSTGDSAMFEALGRTKGSLGLRKHSMHHFMQQECPKKYPEGLGFESVYGRQIFLVHSISRLFIFVRCHP